MPRASRACRSDANDPTRTSLHVRCCSAIGLLADVAGGEPFPAGGIKGRSPGASERRWRERTATVARTNPPAGLCRDDWSVPTVWPESNSSWENWTTVRHHHKSGDNCILA
jgi:hypothetical protein